MTADRTARLAEHARARHDQALQRARAALTAMAGNDEPVTVSRLAAQAAVSRSWIYTQPGLLGQLEQIRKTTARNGPPGRGHRSRASDNSLRLRLELAHQKITQLRAENQQLRRDLAAAHGQLRAAAANLEGTRW